MDDGGHEVGTTRAVKLTCAQLIGRGGPAGLASQPQKGQAQACRIIRPFCWPGMRAEATSGDLHWIGIVLPRRLQIARSASRRTDGGSRDSGDRVVDGGATRGALTRHSASPAR
jgi:hypothetical protein